MAEQSLQDLINSGAIGLNYPPSGVNLNAPINFNPPPQLSLQDINAAISGGGLQTNYIPSGSLVTPPSSVPPAPLNINTGFLKSFTNAGLGLESPGTDFNKLVGISIRVSDGTLKDSAGNLIPKNSALFTVPKEIADSPIFKEVYDKYIKTPITVLPNGQLDHPLLNNQQQVVEELANKIVPVVINQKAAVTTFKERYPGASEADFNIYAANAKADPIYGELTGFDTQDGKMPASKFLSNFEKLSAIEQALYIQKLQEVLDYPIPTSLKAIIKGRLDFLMQNSEAIKGQLAGQEGFAREVSSNISGAISPVVGQGIAGFGGNLIGGLAAGVGSFPSQVSYLAGRINPASIIADPGRALSDYAYITAETYKASVGSFLRSIANLGSYIPGWVESQDNFETGKKFTNRDEYQAVIDKNPILDERSVLGDKEPILALGRLGKTVGTTELLAAELAATFYGGAGGVKLLTRVFPVLKGASGFLPFAAKELAFNAGFEGSNYLLSKAKNKEYASPLDLVGIKTGNDAANVAVNILANSALGAVLYGASGPIKKLNDDIVFKLRGSTEAGERIAKAGGETIIPDSISSQVVNTQRNILNAEERFNNTAQDIVATYKGGQATDEELVTRLNEIYKANFSRDLNPTQAQGYLDIARKEGGNVGLELKNQTSSTLRNTADTSGDLPYGYKLQPDGSASEISTGQIKTPEQTRFLIAERQQDLANKRVLGLEGDNAKSFDELARLYSSDRASQGLYNVLNKTHLINNKVTTFLGKKFYDAYSPVLKIAEEMYAAGKISTAELRGFQNQINDIRISGGGASQAFLKLNPRSREFFEAYRSIVDAGQKGLWNEYAIAKQELSRISSGLVGELTPAEVAAKELKYQKIIDYTQGKLTPERLAEFDNVYNKLSDFSKELDNLAVTYGITDPAVLNLLRESPTSIDDYIRIARDVGIDDASIQVSSKTLKEIGLLNRVQGSEKDVLNLIDVQIARSNLIHSLAARNNVYLSIANMHKAGLLGDEAVKILVKPIDVAAKKALIKELVGIKETKALIQASIDATSKELAPIMNALAKSGASLEVKTARVIDEILNRMTEDVALRPTFQRVLDSYGSELNPVSIRDVALDILRETDNSVYRQIGKIYDLEDKIGPAIKEQVSRQADISQLSKEAKEAYLAQQRIGKINKTGENTVAFYDPALPGSRGILEFQDPKIFEALTNPYTQTQITQFANAAAYVNRTFKAGTTAVNPVFDLLVNPTRDSLQSAVLQGIQVLNPEYYLKSIRDITGSQVADDVLEAAIKGGLTADIQRQAEKISNQTNDIYGQINFGPVRSSVHNLVSGKAKFREFEDILSTSERIMRQANGKAAFIQAKELGYSTADALEFMSYAARNTTVNFNVLGQSTRNLNLTLPYLNAKLRGAATFARAFADNPVEMTLRMGIFISAISAITANNLSNSAKAKTYFSIPEYERDNNIIIVGDPGNVLKIPLPQELAAYSRFAALQQEAHYGINREDYIASVANVLTGLSPIELSGFIPSGQNGLNIGQGIARAAGSITPQILKPFVEAIPTLKGEAGIDLYTGRDLTYGGSQVIDAIAKFLGQDNNNFKGALQNGIKRYTGSVGNMLLNLADVLTGAPEAQQGGRSLGEEAARRFFGISYNQVEADFKQGVRELEKKKSKKDGVQDELIRLDNEIFFANEKGDFQTSQRLGKEKEDKINTFGKDIANFYNNYQDYYAAIGGASPSQVSKLVNLLKFDVVTTAEAGTRAAAEAGAVKAQSTLEARNLARGIGLPVEPIFKRIADETGVDISGTFIGDQGATGINRVKDIKFAFDKVIKGDRIAGVPSIYDILADLYDQKEAAFKAKDYKKLDAIAEQINQRVIAAFQPVIDQYGSVILARDKNLRDQLSNLIEVPYSLTPKFSKGKQPFLTPDKEKYLLSIYGLNPEKVDFEANITNGQAYVQKIEQTVQEGKINTAKSLFRSLDTKISNGTFYLNEPYASRYNSLRSQLK